MFCLLQAESLIHNALPMLWIGNVMPQLRRGREGAVVLARLPEHVLYYEAHHFLVLEKKTNFLIFSSLDFHGTTYLRIIPPSFFKENSTIGKV